MPIPTGHRANECLNGQSVSARSIAGIWIILCRTGMANFDELFTEIAPIALDIGRRERAPSRWSAQIDEENHSEGAHFVAPLSLRALLEAPNQHYKPRVVFLPITPLAFQLLREFSVGGAVIEGKGLKHRGIPSVSLEWRERLRAVPRQCR